MIFPSGRRFTPSSGAGVETVSGKEFMRLSADEFDSKVARSRRPVWQSWTVSRFARRKGAKNEATTRARRSPVVSGIWRLTPWDWCGRSSCMGRTGKITTEPALCFRNSASSAAYESCLPIVPTVATVCPSGSRRPSGGSFRPSYDPWEQKASSCCRSDGSWNAPSPGWPVTVGTAKIMSGPPNPAKP